jgi:fructosamine-3-kinase
MQPVFYLMNYLLAVGSLQNIFNDCGLNVQRYERVHGGDINEAYFLITSTGKYFFKINDSNRYPEMFNREARGLDLLRKNCSIIIPQVIKTGICGGQQYLLLKWLDKGSTNKNMWEKFGQDLALMHKQPQEYFGLDEDNYIGSLKQINKRYNEWIDFYTDCRIMPLVKILFDKGHCSKNDLIAAGNFCKQLKNIFPSESPALLHGDLWSGNYLIHSSGYAAIYDPAVYFGHREMDIGMTKLFGGFDKRFYDAYNETYSLERNWEKRLELTQLYPLLVHAVLFGGHYVSSSFAIIKRF